MERNNKLYMKYIKEYKDIDWDDWDDEEFDNNIESRIVKYIKLTHTTPHSVSKYSVGIVPNSFFGESLCLYLEGFIYSVKYPELFSPNINEYFLKLFKEDTPTVNDVYDVYKSYQSPTTRYLYYTLKNTFDKNRILMMDRISYNHKSMYNDIINNKYKPISY